jgi:histidine triad (HIT) family protein
MNSQNTDPDCIFCKIASGETPSAILYEDEDVVVFPDINPITPVHLMVIPRKHITSLAEMDDEDTPLVGEMTRVANQVAREQGIAENGYRITINSGADSGQIIFHLHMHLMGGRRLQWKH